MNVTPLQRREKPDFHRLLKVLQRKGDCSYVPFFETVIAARHFAPLSGLEPPPALNFTPSLPTFEPSFSFYLNACARLGFDFGIINMFGFRGFPLKRHGSSSSALGFEMDLIAAIRTEEDYETYPWPSAEDINFDTMQRIARLAPEGLGILTGGNGIFQTMCELLGYNGLSLLLCENPDLVKRVADRIGSIMLSAFDRCAALPFVSGIIVCGDMGFKTSTFISPADLGHLVLHWHKKFCKAVHKQKKPIILHSSGNLTAIMDDLCECGYDAKHPFEEGIEPGIFELHRKYGRRLCLLGGLDVDFVCQASEADLRSRVRKMIDTLGPSGGYALGSGSSIPDYLATERYWIMLDEGLKYGRH